MYCNRCGTKLDADDAFCPGCGSPVKQKPKPGDLVIAPPHDQTLVPASEERRTEIRPGSPIDCPRCHAHDAVRKVSAIYSSATSTSVSISTHSTWTTDEATVLAQRLAPPPTPFLFNPGAWGCVSIFAIVAFLCLPAYLWIKELNDVFPPDQSTYVVLITMTVICLVFVLAVVVNKEQTRRKAHVRFEDDMELWLDKNDAWDRLYYCQRCDTVYDPELHRSAPVAAMGTLLT